MRGFVGRATGNFAPAYFASTRCSAQVVSLENSKVTEGAFEATWAEEPILGSICRHWFICDH